MPTTYGHLAGGDLIIQVENDGTNLAEIATVDWDIDPQWEEAGAGLGLMQNTYYKNVGPARGTGKISRAAFIRQDKGDLFTDLLYGAQAIQNEAIAAAATTYTLGLVAQMFSILEIRLATSLKTLREGTDYTVNYATGVITFPIALPEAAIVRYVSQSRRGTQFLLNGGFEDALTNIWIPVATATIARNTVAANVYAETYALAVTPSASNDGVQYNIPLTLAPGRQYRLRLRMKAAGAETIVAKWNDGTTDQTMAPASQTLSTTYAVYEFTFTATKATVPNIKILDSKAGPALFYIDEVSLLDDTIANDVSQMDLMEVGRSIGPFMFNITARRIVDGVLQYRWNKCIVDKDSYKGAMKAYGEDIAFRFLHMFKAAN